MQRKKKNRGWKKKDTETSGRVFAASLAPREKTQREDGEVFKKVH